MQLNLSGEQEQLASAIRAMLEKNYGRAELYGIVDSHVGYDARLWSQLTELGVPGLFVPERWGGGGFSFRATAVVLSEAGRALLSSPLLATTAATAMLLSAGDEQVRAAYLPRICAGELTATVVGNHGLGELGVLVASGPSDDDVLDGEQIYVIDGDTAGLFVVTAISAAGEPRLYAVESDQAGVSVSVMESLDPTRPLSRVRFAGVIGRCVGADTAKIDRGSDLLLTAVAAEAVGAAERMLEMAVEYAKSRVQFERPIGSFQAIKHMCADMLVDLEQARSAALWASAMSGEDAASADATADGAPAAEGPGEIESLGLAAHVAKAYSTDAFVRIAAAAIQVHGGIGFTWEHPAHLYYRRARSSQVLWATPERHLDRIATLLAI